MTAVRSSASNRRQTHSAMQRRHWEIIALAMVLSLGLAVRLALLFKADWFADYDESLVGLMAIDITKGARPVFLYGVPYMGTLESYLAASLFSVFGVSRESLKIVPLAASLLWVVSTYLLARRLWGQRAAVAAAAIAACPPLYIVVNTLKAWGATIEVMALGNLILLFTVNAVDASRPRCRALWVVLLGLVTGLGFWLYWLVAYYAVAALLYVAGRRPKLLLPGAWWPAIPAFFLASLPLWLYNLRHPWATFSYLLGPGKPPISTPSHWDIAVDLFGNLVPRVLGGQATTPQWLGTAGVVLAALAMALSLMVCLCARVRASSQKSEVIVLFLIVVPALYLASGFGSAALNPWGVDAAGRYVVPLYGGAALALGALYHFARRVKLGAQHVAAAVLAFTCAVNLVSVLQADGIQSFQSPYYNRAPASFSDVIAALDAEGVRDVWTDVGLGEPLMFQTKQRVSAADYLDRSSGGIVRFPAAYDAVSRAPRAAFLVAVLPGQVGPLEREFQRLAIPYHKRDLGKLALLIPEQTVAPSTVAGGLGYQY